MNPATREDYSEFQDFSFELLNEFGRDIILRRNEDVPVDPDKPYLGHTTTSTDYNTPALSDNANGRNIAQELVEIGTLIYYIPAKDLAISPQVGDLILDGAALPKKIQTVNTINPGIANILYIVSVS